MPAVKMCEFNIVCHNRIIMSGISRHNDCKPGCKVYIGNLTRGASKDELEKAFSYYGNVNHIFVARNPPGFAFVEFEDPRDARDSVEGLDGRIVCDTRLRVELAHGRGRSKHYNGRHGSPGSSFGRQRRLDRSPSSRSPSPSGRKIYNNRTARSRSHSFGRSRRRSMTPPDYHHYPGRR
ncbi:hypothetical protein GJ496_003163 [Pomphorhynchus laevis]|nr:hypothetical protein GJ496_003163 [Pomphorhynchus laevis]